MAQYQVQDPAGEMHLIEGPDNATPDEITMQAQTLIPQPSKMESFARGAGNNFPLLPQAIAGGEALTGIGDEGGYSKNLKDWNAKAAAAKAANPITYGAGAVAGAAAPLLVPGVGEALEAAPIAGNAALGAANALSNEDLSKDLGGNLGKAAMGAATGAGMAYGLGKLMPKPATLTGYAGEQAIKSTGIPPAVLAELEPEEHQALGQFLIKNDLVGADKEKMLSAAKDLEDEIGEKIGSIGKETGGLTVGYPEHDAAIGRLATQGKNLAGYADAENRGLSNSYNAWAQNLKKLGLNPTWQEIQEMKGVAGRAAFKNTGEIKNEAAKDAYFELRGMLKGIAKEAQGKPGLANEYKEALANYTKIQPVVGGLQKLVGRERAGAGGGGVRGLAGLIRGLPGQKNPAINLPTAAMVGATMHPALGLIAATPTLANPAIRSNAASAMARNLPGIRQGISSELNDFLTSRYGQKKENKE